jgi:hypothetical protein
MTIMNDRRSKIIARMFVVLKGLVITLTDGTIPANRVVHNRNELPAELVPGLILLDADEVADTRVSAPPPGRQTPPRDKMMRMTPEVYIVLDVRKPHNENAGEDLNLARAQIMYALLTDRELQDLCGANGEICYDGCVTDLARNRVMQGQMGMSITFVYPFLLPELKSQ